MTGNNGYSRKNDNELMLYVQGDNHKAYEVLFKRHQLPLFMFLTRKYSGFFSPDEIDDFVQESFFKVYKHRNGYKADDEAIFKTWFYKIGINLVINELRRRSKVKFISIDNAYNTDNGDGVLVEDRIERLVVEPNQESLVAAREIKEVVENIPSRYRDVIELREQGFEYKEISAMLCERLGTVKSMVHRGRELLRKQLEPEEVRI